MDSSLKIQLLRFSAAQGGSSEWELQRAVELFDELVRPKLRSLYTSQFVREEILQIMRLKFVQFAQGFKSGNRTLPTSVEAYVQRIALSAVADYWRSENRAVSVETLEEWHAVTDFQGTEIEFSPGELGRVIETLQIEHRTAILLGGAMTSAEVFMVAMEVTAGTSKRPLQWIGECIGTTDRAQISDLVSKIPLPDPEIARFIMDNQERENVSAQTVSNFRRKGRETLARRLAKMDRDTRSGQVGIEP